MIILRVLRVVVGLIVTAGRCQNLHLPLLNFLLRIYHVRSRTSVLTRHVRRSCDTNETFITTRMLKSKRPRQKVDGSLLYNDCVRGDEGTRQTIVQPISFTLAISITSNSKRQANVQTVKRRQTWHGSPVSVRLVNGNRALTAMFLPPVIQFENGLHVSALTYIRHSIMRHNL